MVRLFESLTCHIGRWIKSFFRVILPQHCAVCGALLTIDESCICVSCFARLPFTHLKGKHGNWLERYCWGQIPICRASAYLKYLPLTDSRLPFIALKYKGDFELARYFGKVMATELVNTDFFDGIDYIVPIPLAKDRLRRRGYNQSSEIAKGVSLISGIPVREDLVSRIVSNESQTHFTPLQRRENVKHIFRYIGPDLAPNTHLLLIDDIFTTGSTLFSCAEQFCHIPSVRISILVLGISHIYPYITSLDNVYEEDPLSPFGSKRDKI